MKQSVSDELSLPVNVVWVRCRVVPRWSVHKEEEHSSITVGCFFSFTGNIIIALIKLTVYSRQ